MSPRPLLTLSLGDGGVLQLREITQEVVDKVVSDNALKLELRDEVLRTHSTR